MSNENHAVKLFILPNNVRIKWDELRASRCLVNFALENFQLQRKGCTLCTNTSKLDYILHYILHYFFKQKEPISFVFHLYKLYLSRGL